MHLYLNDRSARALGSLGVLVLIVGGLIYLGNKALIASGAKTDPDDRKAEARQRFERSCKAKGGRPRGHEFEEPSCFVTLRRYVVESVPIVSVYPPDAAESDAAVRRSGTWDRKALAENRAQCRSAIEDWRRGRRDDRRYRINLYRDQPKPHFIRRSGLCDERSAE